VPNKVNIAVRERIEREADPIGFYITVAKGEAIDAAVPIGPDRDHTEAVKIYPTLDQRLGAQRVLVNKLLPDAKSVPVNLELPQISSATDVLTAHNVLVAAVASGGITPDAAETLSAILENRRKAIETVEFERRIAALEGK
jgi:IMP dehydrogenase/GMP reductase